MQLQRVAFFSFLFLLFFGYIFLFFLIFLVFYLGFTTFISSPCFVKSNKLNSSWVIMSDGSSPEIVELNLDGFMFFPLRMGIHPLGGLIPWRILSCQCCWFFHNTSLFKSCNHHRSVISQMWIAPLYNSV